jgi:hypothetical protein
MTKHYELTLTDEDLVADIELLGSVILAVNLLLHPRHLTDQELDEALGVPHPQSAAIDVPVLAEGETLRPSRVIQPVRRRLHP